MSVVCPLTSHAITRSKQRSIPPIVIDWLISYGTRLPAGGGCETAYFDKKARRKLMRDLGSWAYSRLEQKLDSFAVLAEDGRVITTGVRTKRLRIG